MIPCVYLSTSAQSSTTQSTVIQSTNTQSTTANDNTDVLHLSEPIAAAVEETDTSDSTLHSEHEAAVPNTEEILEGMGNFDTTTKIESSSPNSENEVYSIEIDDYADGNIKSDSQDKANSELGTVPYQPIKLNQHISTTHTYILESNIQSGSLESSKDEKHVTIPQTGTTEFPHRHRHAHERTTSGEEPSVYCDYNPKQESRINDHGDEHIIVDEKYKTTTVKHHQYATVVANGSFVTSDTTGGSDKDVNTSVVNTETIPKPIQEVTTLAETNINISSLPSITDPSTLPSDSKLPTLPNIKDLAPLPELEELQPVNADDLDKLPDLNRMPSIDNLPPISLNRSLPFQTDDTQPSTSYSREISPLPDNEVKGNEKKKQIEAPIDVGGNETDNMQESVVATSYVLQEDHSHTTSTHELTTKSLDKHSQKGNLFVEAVQIKDKINDNAGTSHLHIANKNMHLNESKHGMHNASLGEGDSLILSEVVGNSPIMQRLDTDNKDTDYKWMPLDWSDVSTIIQH